MAASSPKKGDLILGLTPSEAKLIILGVVSSNEPPKVDMNKLAEKGGYKLGSASVLYNKAKRKLFELHGDAANGATASTADDASPALGPSGGDIGAPATPTPKKTPGRRKQDNAAVTPVKRKGTPANDESTAEPPMKTAVDPETPKPKRQRKTPAKKGRGAAAESNGADGEASGGIPKDNTTTTPTIKPEPNVNVTVKTELTGDDDDPFAAELETELGSDIIKGEYDEMFDANTMDTAPTTCNAWREPETLL
ncbi:hypothetical protein VTN02DRAFT_2165 [Thermoascus thermophilus]